jgi:integrase
VIPLPALATELLEACPRLGNRYIFTTDGKSPVASVSKATNKLRKLMTEGLRERTGDPKAEIPNFRLHDLRRTCATLMAGLELAPKVKVAPHVIDAVQNHISGTIKGVSRTYNRYQYLDEKREALERWAEELRKQVAPVEAAQARELQDAH